MKYRSAMSGIIGAIVAFCIASLSPAYAGDIPAAGPLDTGNQLVTMCNDSNYKAGNEAWSYCLAYVVGVADGIDGGILYTFHDYSGLSAEAAGTKERLVSRYCIPTSNVTYAQMGLVVSKYLHEHPETLNHPSVALVVDSFRDAWPCSNNKKK